ncbi:MAG TPA: hypothetical protein PKE19_00875 [Aestuariivirga sp.]|nr:hypothetical protein [Aestuariivirga sp.]
MWRTLDFSSWQSILSTLIGLALFTFLGIGIRLLVQMTVQQRRERMNRQINERLRTLIAAYKTLGGSFTGDLAVDPTHRRDLRRRAETPVETAEAAPEAEAQPLDMSGGSDRARRIRDAVEASLSDIILLGTEEQVKLAAAAAHDLVAGKPVHTHDLVVSLRNFIREALDLAPIPETVALPRQGPTRPGSGGSGGGGRGRGGGETAGEGGGRGRGAGGGGGMGGAGMGMGGVGLGLGLGAHHAAGDPTDPDSR